MVGCGVARYSSPSPRSRNSSHNSVTDKLHVLTWLAASHGATPAPLPTAQSAKPLTWFCVLSESHTTRWLPGWFAKQTPLGTCVPQQSHVKQCSALTDTAPPPHLVARFFKCAGRCPSRPPAPAPSKPPSMPASVSTSVTGGLRSFSQSRKKMSVCVCVYSTSAS